MEATLTLHQAGNQLGVEDTVLSRLIRIGALPEARKVHRPDGDVWMIPADALEAVATRNGWTIDLRNDGGAILTSDGEDHRELGALVPHQDSVPAEDSPGEPADDLDPMPSMAEVVDLALLDRLLDVQEERVTAQVEARETKHALSALNENHNRTTGELEIERRERMITSDRYREERMARAVADAKVAELRDRVVREMALAEAEKQASSEALARSIRAERDAANAMALMSWRARRRYRKLFARGE